MQINSIGNGFSKLQTVNFKGDDNKYSKETKQVIKDLARAFVNNDKVELKPEVVDLFQPKKGCEFLFKEMKKTPRSQDAYLKAEITKDFLNVLEPKIKKEVFSEVDNEIQWLQAELDDLFARNGVAPKMPCPSAETWFNEKNSAVFDYTV